MNKIGIIDYGMGNLGSVSNACKFLELDAQIISAPGQLDTCRAMILPGVGAFGDCAAGLRAAPGMWETLEARVAAGVPFLGICVGMQLMATRGLEHGAHDGFGWIAGEVIRLRPADPALKVPHMGWNALENVAAHPLFAGIAPGDHAYFVHSYHLVPRDPAHRLATVDHGGPVTAAVGRDAMAGVQFHPAKSQRAGLRLIANFLSWRP